MNLPFGSSHASYQIMSLLEEANSVSDSLLQEMPCYFILCTSNGQILFHSKLCEQIYKNPKNIKDLFDTESSSQFLILLQSLSNRRNPMEKLLLKTQKEQSVTLNIRGMDVPNSETLYLAVGLA